MSETEKTRADAVREAASALNTRIQEAAGDGLETRVTLHSVHPVANPSLECDLVSARIVRPV